MKQIPTSDFADDDGTADPTLREALQRYRADADSGPVLVALSDARLLLPVVASLGESEVGHDGLVRDRTADVSAAFLTGRDGRRALLAFTGTDALQAWRPDARPVPVSMRDAARSALLDDGSAVVLDIAGPVTYAVETREARDFAAGRRVLRAPEGYAWVEPLTTDG